MATNDSPSMPTISLNEPHELADMEPVPLASLAEQKKKRRQTAFYPKMNPSNTPQKPFSRSAAKRESVMALGSIEHLQHFFTKTGLTAKKRPTMGNKKNFVPAIGGHLKSPSVVNGIPELTFDLPPSPMVPQPTHRPFPQIEKDYETDPNELLPTMVDDLENVSLVWGITSKPAALGDRPFDILHVLKVTTHAIRSVRNYLVALPDDHHAFQAPQPSFRHTHLSVPTRSSSRPSSRPSTSPSGTPSLLAPPSAQAPAPPPEDNLSRIRRAALDVLTVLRHLEESYRQPMSDDGYGSDNASNVGDWSGARSRSSMGRVASPSSGDETDSVSTASFAFSNNGTTAFGTGSVRHISRPGRTETFTVWSDGEEEPFDVHEEPEKREPWDERLVLGGGWLYRSGLDPKVLTKDRPVIERYLNVVDETLFGGKKGSEGKRGWDRALDKLRSTKSVRRVGSNSSLGSVDSSRKVRRVFSGSSLGQAMAGLSLSESPTSAYPDEAEEDEDIPEEEEEGLPDWASRLKFVDDFPGRLRSLLISSLPTDMLPMLPLPMSPPSSPISPSAPSPTNTDKAVLLAALTSGQLLCFAYNNIVRKSSKPWGYINQGAVHDIAAMEAAEREEQAKEEEARESMNEAEKEQQKEKARARRKGWTFRRTENLRLWAAALKLRYLIPLITPQAYPGGSHIRGQGGRDSNQSTPSTSPNASLLTFAPVEPPFFFDPAQVARKAEGWEEMLEGALVRWVAAVGRERRGE